MRKVAGDAARAVGNLTGLGTGALQTAEDIKDGAVLVARLFDITEPWRVPRGEAAWDEVAGGVKAVMDNSGRAFSEPRAVMADLAQAARQKQRELDPRATPEAPTLGGEVGRNFRIGRNQGEALVEGAGWVLGAAELKAASAASRLSKAERIAKHVDQGFSKRQARYLADPYKGKGHHSLIPERARLPQFLGGGPYPRWVMDSPFNRLHPSGISRGEFYELHSHVDRDFRYARLPRKKGPGGWSAKDLGIQLYGPLDRVYYGTPGPTKAVVGGAAVAAGGYLNEAMEEGGWR